MKHVLFVVLPERGHIHPFLGAAHALRRRGARVSFYAPRDVRSILGPLGWEDVHAPDGAGPPAAEHRGEAFSELLADPARLRRWIRAMLVDAAEPSIAPLRAHLGRVRPDVVVIDPMAYFAAIAAHEEQLPWLGLSTSLNPCIRDDVESELLSTLRSLDDARHALFRARGMPVRFRVSDVLSPLGTFVLSTSALLGPDLPDDGVPVHLVGAALPAPAEGTKVLCAGGTKVVRSGRPLVYVSFGSQAYHQPAHLRVVLDAAREVDARFVVAMGELASSELVRGAPSNVEVVPFAPQVELLAEASVAITHGGANSVHEGLAHAVPLLVSPICNDQHHNASLVAASGAGRVVDLAAADRRAVAETLRELLGMDAPERKAAASIARTYHAAGGAGRIAEVVLGAA
jgi:UDP:flavonoid glycosyltransferase YjiC (YdhE family)